MGLTSSDWQIITSMPADRWFIPFSYCWICWKLTPAFSPRFADLCLTLGACPGAALNFSVDRPHVVCGFAGRHENFALAGCSTLCTGSASIARQLEIATPDSSLMRPCELLSIGVGPIARPRPIHSIAALNQPAIDVSAVGAEADSHKPHISIALNEFAAGRAELGKKPSEFVGRLSSAPIAAAVDILAFLPALRRIDTVQADARASDLDRVAVNHGRVR